MSVSDRWRGARVGPGSRWEVRYRDVAGRQRKRRFETRTEAAAFDARQRLSPDRVLAEDGRRLTVDEMTATWLASKATLKPKSIDAATYQRREILLTFSGRLATSLGPREVRTWLARPRGVAVRRGSFGALAASYRMAIADGLLDDNPCAGLRMPPTQRSSRRALTWDELAALAAEAGRWGPLVWLLGTTGLRLGEAIGLRVEDVLVGRQRLRVVRAVVDTSAGRVVGPPKSGYAREVGVAPFVLAQLPTKGRRRDDWLFTGAQGGRLDAGSWRRQALYPAAERAGLGRVVPHELRHTAASLAIQGGASVMDVCRMLGHASPDITARVYMHEFDQGVDRVSRIMQTRGDG